MRANSKSQIVVAFGRRADGRPARAGAGRGGYGDGRRNAVDPLGRRLFQPLEKLTGVRRKALDIAALPFGVERVESQAAFAAAADAAEHDQPPLRQVEIDVLEIVYLDATERDDTFGHCGSLCRLLRTMTQPVIIPTG